MFLYNEHVFLTLKKKKEENGGRKPITVRTDEQWVSLPSPIVSFIRPSCLMYQLLLGILGCTRDTRIINHGSCPLGTHNLTRRLINR